ncbi:MAG: hypothetical protein BM564_08660 [Bacteroidetes bacterium MedPE-SWsnd-G2]|nr:MAG: hypothetical protein BM564_08660 [Bacteroidetes bacterium MedPE-SWsnd-G2]
MKQYALYLYSAFVFSTLVLYGNLSINSLSNSQDKTQVNDQDNLNKSGMKFFVHHSKMNSKYSEIGSGVFRNKFIVVSSKKIGGLGNGVDERTNQPYTELFCMDLDGYGTLSNPLLYSRIINTKNNEGLIAFTPDQQTMYFTRAMRETSNNYQLYKTRLQTNSAGNWIDQEKLAISSPNYSIESPHVSADGKTLYFASNMGGTVGGFDIYSAEILSDGTLGQPHNLGPNVNTAQNEKYPYTSPDGESLYFSSEGHNSIGGYDVFVSAIKESYLGTPRHLGTDINSTSNDISFKFIQEDKGFISSDREGSIGSFDIFRFKSQIVYQDIKGLIVDNTNAPIPNANIFLMDGEDNIIERQITGSDSGYKFKIQAYGDYKLKVMKFGFEPLVFDINATESNGGLITENLELVSNGATSVTDN